MTTNVQVTNLKVSKYTTNANIYSLQVRKEGRETWYYINGDHGFKSPEWSLDEAIEYYLSPEGKNEREIAFMKAWGFYD